MHTRGVIPWLQVYNYAIFRRKLLRHSVEFGLRSPVVQKTVLAEMCYLYRRTRLRGKRGIDRGPRGVRVLESDACTALDGGWVARAAGRVRTCDHSCRDTYLLRLWWPREPAPGCLGRGICFVRDSNTGDARFSEDIRFFFRK